MVDVLVSVTSLITVVSFDISRRHTASTDEWTA